jgi:hypothetical protein
VGRPVIFGLTGEELLYGYGPLGVFAVAAGVALRTMFQYIVKDRDRAVEQRDQMADDMFQKALPLLTRTADLLEKRTMIDTELMAGFRDAQRLAGQAEDVLKDVRRMLERQSS